MHKVAQITLRDQFEEKLILCYINLNNSVLQYWQ